MKFIFGGVLLGIRLTLIKDYSFWGSLMIIIGLAIIIDARIDEKLENIENRLDEVEDRLNLR